jgi:hypothetical protein
MQTTLRIDDEIYRAAKAQAAATGTTLTRFIEEALRKQLGPNAGTAITPEMRERNELMEALLKRTAHFRIGKKPTRKEMNER